MGHTITATRITPRTAVGSDRRICARCGIEFGTNPRKAYTECRDCRSVDRASRNR